MKMTLNKLKRGRLESKNSHMSPEICQTVHSQHILENQHGKPMGGQIQTLTSWLIMSCLIVDKTNLNKVNHTTLRCWREDISQYRPIYPENPLNKYRQRLNKIRIKLSTCPWKVLIWLTMSGLQQNLQEKRKIQEYQATRWLPLR